MTDQPDPLRKAPTPSSDAQRPADLQKPVEPQKPSSAPAPPPRQASYLQQVLGSSTLVVVLAVVIALVVAAVLIVVTNEDVRGSAGYLFARPNDFVYYSTNAVGDAFGALLRGSVYNWEADTFRQGIRSLTETMTVSVPLIFAALGLGIGFRAGLFNIGAQGQIVLGATVGGFIGFAMDLPVVVHLLIAVVGAFLGGALWGGIAGFLKARTGANEVIVTIMLNSVALYLLAYLLTTDLFQGGATNQPISAPVADTARYPLLLGFLGYRIHAGFLLALVAAVAVWWLMERSTLGFQFRAIGENPHAARTAGMNVENGYLWVMVIAGGLAGLGGSAQILGTERALTGGIAASFGFDAITVALLGRSRPLGTVLAALLFGGLRAGGFAMQGTGVPIDLILVIQSLIVLFIAAPPLVRGLFLLPSEERTKRKLDKQRLRAATKGAAA
ncbi:hypothetical protein GCM10028777_22320 [Angustibacter speluncae]